ncbi:hypothetical protein cypCar_00033702 [Cyprinus carpio]|nr:hypothetical protein cypCar_00033702 [Cyprinus carpio]
MRKPSDTSPRRLSDISPQIRQLKSLVITDEDLSEELKLSRSVEYINNASIEERILRITGYYGCKPWDASLRGEDQSNSEKVEVKCCQFLGDDGLSLRMLLSCVAPFGVLWTLTSYLYLQGLRRIPATDACALFFCSRAFVFLISWIVLRDRFMGVRIVAAILAIGGIVMMTYADGFHSYSVIGISLVVGSAFTAAIYKVLFKLVLGSAKRGEATVYLTVLGGANLVFISAVPLILLITGAEDFVSPRELPWPSICGMSALLLGKRMDINA